MVTLFYVGFDKKNIKNIFNWKKLLGAGTSSIICYFLLPKLLLFSNITINKYILIFIMGIIAYLVAEFLN